MNPALPEPAHGGLLQRVGALALHMIAVLGEVVLLAQRAVRGIPARTWPKGEVIRQAYSAGNKSMLLLGFNHAFLGMVLVFYAATQARRAVGDLSIVGPGYIALLVREFGPTIAALMVAARVGAGIAAELGSMVVTEQVDALRMNGADPVRFLVSPRIIAVTVMNLVLAVYASVVALLAGAATARAYFGVSYHTFLDLRFTEFGEVTEGLVKSVAFGLWIGLSACHAGLTTRGGSQGVGRATTHAVVRGSLGVIVLDVILGSIFVTLRM